MSTFNRIRSRLARDSRNGWLGGVCAGFGRTLNIDPKFLRAGLVVLAVVFPRIVIAAYLVAWILLPHLNEIDHPA